MDLHFAPVVMPEVTVLVAARTAETPNPATLLTPNRQESSQSYGVADNTYLPKYSLTPLGKPIDLELSIPIACDIQTISPSTIPKNT